MARGHLGSHFLVVLLWVVASGGCSSVTPPAESPSLVRARLEFEGSSKGLKERLALIRALETNGPERDRVLHRGGTWPKGEEPWRKEVIQLAEEGLVLRPDHAGLHNVLGAHLYLIKAERPRALELFRQASSLDPKWSVPHFNIGLTLSGDKAMIPQSIEAYYRAVALQPNYWQAWENLGELLLEIPNRESEAIRAFREAVKANGFMARLPFALGKALLKVKGNSDEIERRFRTAILLDSSVWAYREALIDLLAANKGRRDEAWQTVLEAVDRFPKSGRVVGKALSLAMTQVRSVDEIDRLARGFDRIELRAEVPWFELGRAYFVHKEAREKAKSAFRKVLASGKDVSPANYNLGQLELYQGGEAKKAIEYYRAAIEANPQNAEAHTRLLVARTAAEGWNSGTEEALIELLHMAAERPAFLEELLRYAETDLPTDRFMIFGKQVPTLYPKSAQAWRLLAKYYTQKPSDFPLGLAAAESAYRLDSASFWSRRYYALYLAAFPERHKEAIPLLESCIQEKDDYADARLLLGHLQSLLGLSPQDALKNLDRAVQLEPKNWRCYASRAFAHGQANRWEAALSDYEKAMALGARIQEVGSDHLIALVMLERYDDAITLSAKVIEADPNNVDAGEMRAISLDKLKRSVEALAEIERVGQLNPAAVHLWRRRASILESLDRWEDALNWRTYIVSSMEGRGYDYLDRGLLLAKLGQYDRARSDFETALSLDPNDAAAHGALSDLEIGIGQWGKAWVHMRRCADLYQTSEERWQFVWVLAQLAGQGSDFPAQHEPSSGPGGLRVLTARNRLYLDWREGQWRELNRQITEDLKLENEASRRDAYTAMLRWIVATRAGEPFSAHWLAEYEETAESDWARSLLHYFQGKISEEELVQRSGKGNRAEVRAQRCEAAFYRAAQAEWRGELDKARQLLRECLSNRVLGFIECTYAQFDLARLEHRKQ